MEEPLPIGATTNTCPPAEQADMIHEQSPIGIEKLPTEMLYHIFRFLDGRNIDKCANVCQLWRKITNTMWQNLCEKAGYKMFWLPSSARATAANEHHAWRDLWMLYFFMNNRELRKEGKEGQGFYFSDTCGVYRGEFKNNLKCGRGIQEWTDGSRYEGEWLNDKRNGYGTYIWPDGRRFEGTHVLDKRYEGTFYWPEGSIYTGSYKDSLRHGQGSFFWPDGDSFNGHWMRGARKGPGILTCRQNGSEENWLQQWEEKTFDFRDKGARTRIITGEEDPAAVLQECLKEADIEVEETIEGVPSKKRKMNDSVNNNNNNNNNNEDDDNDNSKKQKLE